MNILFKLWELEFFFYCKQDNATKILVKQEPQHV